MEESLNLTEAVAAMPMDRQLALVIDRLNEWELPLTALEMYSELSVRQQLQLVASPNSPCARRLRHRVGGGMRSRQPPVSNKQLQRLLEIASTGVTEEQAKIENCEGEKEEQYDEKRVGEEEEIEGQANCSTVLSPVDSSMSEDQYIQALIVDYLKSKGRFVEEAEHLEREFLSFQEEESVRRKSSSSESKRGEDVVVSSSKLAELVRSTRSSEALLCELRDEVDQLNLHSQQQDDGQLLPQRLPGDGDNLLFSGTTASSSNASCNNLDAKLLQSQQNLVALSEKCKKSEKKAEAVLRSVADRLPTIIASVGSSKKECLIPVILSVIEHHDVSSVRRSLCFYLLNLFMRPNTEQRQSILDGLRDVCNRMDRGLIENEIIGEVWALVSHKYSEKRTLAVMSAGVLADYVQLSTKTALFTNVLIPASQDVSGSVRAAACASLERLWGPFVEPHFSQAIELVVRLAVDESPKVSVEMMKRMDNILCWCGASGVLITTFAPIVLSAVAQLLRTPHIQTVTDERTTTLTDIFDTVLGKAVETVMNSELEAVASFCRENLYPICFSLFSSEEGVANERAIVDIAASLARLTSLLGDKFCHEVVGKLFESYLAESGGSALSVQCVLVSVAVYHCTSIVPPVAPATVELLMPIFLRAMRAGPPLLDSLTTSLGVIGKRSEGCARTAIEVLWKLVETPEKQIKLAAVALLLQILPTVSEKVAISTVWPSFLLLLNDQDPEIQRCAVRGAVILASGMTSKQNSEKIFSTVDASADAAGTFSVLSLALLDSWKELMKTIPVDIREEFVFTQLAAHCAAYVAQRAMLSSEQRVAHVRQLLDVFASIAVCAVITLRKLQQSVIPSLRCLLKDIEGMGEPALKQRCVAMIKEFSSIEAHLKPQGVPMSFFDKVKQEINNMVKK